MIRRAPAVAAVVAAAMVAVQCAETTSAPDDRPSASPVGTPTTVRPGASGTPNVAAARVFPVSVAELGATWRPGCPVPAEGLRRVNLAYVGSDGRTHRGDLVVAADLVDDVVDVFAELYRQRFPITRMQTVDRYPGASDEASMRDDNTSAFNCRPLPSGRWSLHALGRAVDVNPLRNPYVSGRDLQPATAGAYLDRSRTDPGMLRAGDPAVEAFVRRGWRWGGDWRLPKDYQHFEMP